MQPALDCEACGALTPGERFRYYADQIVCEACNERNPQSRRRLVPRALLQPRSVCVNFLECRGLALQAMALDHRTMLGPQLRIQSADTLRRLLAYLGATPEQLTDYDNCQRRWGQGHCPDHASAVPQEPAQDRLSAAFTRNGLRPARDTFQLGHPEKIRRMKDDPMKWDGKVYRPAGRASVGTLPTVRNGKPRTPGGARSMRKCELRKFETALCGIPSGRNRRCWHASGKRSATFSFRLVAAIEIGLSSARSDQVLPVQVPLASSALCAA